MSHGDDVQLPEASALSIDAPVWRFRSGPYCALGTCFDLACNDVELGEWLDDLYGHLRCPRGAAEGQPVHHIALATARDGHGGGIFCDGALRYSSESSYGAVSWFVGVSNRIVTQQRSRRYLLHAAGVARRGAAIVLPGEMEVGKSTLATGLCLRGYDYLSDEAIEVAPALPGEPQMVRGFSKPISLDHGSFDVVAEASTTLPSGDLERFQLRRWLIDAKRLSRVTESAQAAFVIFPTYRPGSRTQLHSLSSSEAVSRLEAVTFPTVAERHDRLQAAVRLVEASTCCELSVSDLDVACDLITGLVREAGSGST